MNRRILLLGQAMLAALASLVALFLAGGRPAVSVLPERDRVAERGQDPSIEESIQPAPAVLDDPTSRQVLAAEPPEAPEEMPFGASTILAEGTVVVIDELGLEHSAADGSLSIHPSMPGPGVRKVIGSRRVDITGGRFQFVLDAPLEFSVGDVVLGERTAILEDGWTRYAIDEGPILVRVRLPKSLRLHVVDSSTRAPLRSITLVMSWRGDELHPGDLGTINWRMESDSSPVVIEPSYDLAQRKVGTCFARSPGYAWGSIQLDFGGGERWIELGPGGALNLVLRGDLSGKRTFLRLRQTGASERRPFAAIEVGGRDQIAVEGLPPGAYDLALELENWYEPTVLASATAEITAGSTTPADLWIDAPAVPARVPLEGTQVLPPEWKLAHFSLFFWHLDPPPDGKQHHSNVSSERMQRIDDPSGTYTWQAGDVFPGRYSLQIHQLGYSMLVEVGPDGRRDVLMTVPPPGSVSVQVTVHAPAREAVSAVEA